MMQQSKSLQIESTWEQMLIEKLAIFGHRNWIVVADSAYPAQSSTGIETIFADASPIEVLHKVLEAISGCHHICATAYTDLELQFVEENDAPGISDYRRQLDAALEGFTVKRLLHDEVIASLDESARTFQIFIIKTPLAIPYTSVFLSLDCGYWSQAAELRLRQSLARQHANDAL